MEPGLRSVSEVSGRRVTVTAGMSRELAARLDRLAASWGVSRAAAVRRLIELANVEGLEPLEVPDMKELTRIAAEKARGGNMAAVSWLAMRQPDKREVELQRLLARLGANDT